MCKVSYALDSDPCELVRAALTAFAQGTPATLSVSGSAVITGGNAFAVNGTGSITGFGTPVLSAAGTIDPGIPASGQTPGPDPKEPSLWSSPVAMC